MNDVWKGKIFTFYPLDLPLKRVNFFHHGRKGFVFLLIITTINEHAFFDLPI